MVYNIVFFKKETESGVTGTSKAGESVNLK